MNKEAIKQKIKWVGNNEDINYQGESDDFRVGFVTALELVLDDYF